MAGLRVFITAAEASGDRNAAGLASAIRRRHPGAVIEGYGGPAMAAAGVTLLAETVGRARMGLGAFLRAAEVAPLLRRARAMHADNPPDLAVCVDSWTMNKHFAAAAKKRAVPVFYYVAPQAWASREGRVRKLREVVDALGCILPFEEPWFRERGVPATFVGHPLFDTLSRDRSSSEPAAALRRNGPVVGLLPGSRRAVARANFPRMIAVSDLVRGRFPAATFVVPTTPATDAVVRAAIAGRGWVTAELGGFDDLLRRCDLALTVSGTATLHAAAWGVPMVAVYAGSRVLWHGAGRWVVRLRTYTQPNLLAGRTDPADRLVPEFIPWYGPVGPAADAVIGLLGDPASLAKQRAGLIDAVRPLDRPGASDRAADLALSLIRG